MKSPTFTKGIQVRRVVSQWLVNRGLRTLALPMILTLLCCWRPMPAAGSQPQPEPPVLDWFSIDGGGGQSTGGDFILSGSLGQLDVGAQSGGNYRLIGGFWTIMVQPRDPEPQPALRIALAGTTAVISWPGSATGFHLEETLGLAFPISWGAVLQAPILVNGEYTVTISATAGARFYRLRKP